MVGCHIQLRRGIELMALGVFCCCMLFWRDCAPRGSLSVAVAACGKRDAPLGYASFSNLN